MKQRILCFGLILSVLLMLLSGCGLLENPFKPSRQTETDGAAKLDNSDKRIDYRHKGIPAFSEMEYSRPDMEEYERLKNALCSTAKVSSSARQMLEQLMDVYNFYNNFYTMLNLANIHYCLDLQDEYYAQEYAYCSQQSSVVEQGLEACYMALAQSQAVDELESDKYLGPGFLDSYQSESKWTEEFTQLMTQESNLVAESYSMMNELAELEYYSDEYFETGLATLGELLVEMVTLRQEIATELGYDSYEDFAFGYYYDRDYTPEAASSYLNWVQTELTPLYEVLNNSEFWHEAYGNGTSAFACRGYLQSATAAMGGRLASAYQLMTEKELYDISYSANKYQGSFEVYLPRYSAPYVFLNPAGDNTDYLSFAHEFGHFASDYFGGGSYTTTDVSEFFSQGMEYLSLCYAAGDANTLDALRQLKLADSLNTYVEQSAYAKFEEELYKLPPEELSVSKITELYEEICQGYGFDSWNWDSRDWITIPHFFTAPYYVLSYVSSNDAAMQLFGMEMESPGSGLEAYTACMQECPPQFMAFVQKAGLQSPFTEERLAQVKSTLETVLDWLIIS